MAEEVEEFQESEVIFSDLRSCRYEEADDGCFGFSKRLNSGKFEKNSTEKKMADCSLPVNVSRRRRHCFTVFDYGGEADELEGGELVPPHVILESRVAGKMAFSVCSGNGRTLKGRDLCQVRNSVLRMTGFLEA
ncbi:uncharacterized protein LOC108452469 [Gossypium arboreum]|uniref:Senescence regulator S40 n=1 Tax=Gossypium arboreum TaxID=29729 RepID=A0ABR0PWR3_GOSAR|nr:uncharacterized protein LOC108452469 [Gossypium arboreum]KAK5831276.1 hypothetical protein PVK06_015071 [Gossypium arboreum]